MFILAFDLHLSLFVLLFVLNFEFSSVRFLHGGWRYPVFKPHLIPKPSTR